jgi:hypothetical protein
MRRKYDFSGAAGFHPQPSHRRLVPRKRVGRRQTGEPLLHEPEPELTKEWIRELKRRVADLKDPVRYLLVSDLGRRPTLFYDVSDGVYAWKDPKAATLFKNRADAVAVQKVLGRSIKVLRCTTRRYGGKRVFARFLR